jgi:hypothetical protein
VPLGTASITAFAASMREVSVGVRGMVGKSQSRLLLCAFLLCILRAVIHLL